MANALFAFDDRAAAQRAIGELTEAGVPADAVRLHAHDVAPGGIKSEADELATGGFLTNFLEMFDGVFEWGGSPHDASAYAAVVRRGGAVLSVDAATDEQRAAIDRVMQTASCKLRTDWSNQPTR